MDQSPQAPAYESLVDDLKSVRRAGLVQLRTLPVPALETAVHAAGHAEPDEDVDAADVEVLLREAIGELNDEAATLASVLFGLTPGTRGDDPARLRREAAGLVAVSVSWFRHKQEPELIHQLADVILRMAREYRLRLARLRMEHHTPVSSRLAVHWVERFEAYYALWTPIYALGADLTAYRSTLLEPDRPYDREPTEEEPEGYTQELQAAGYGTNALFHYACYLYGVDSFIRSHGGLWLFSSKQVEEEVTGAIALIGLYAPTNEQDESYLRICHNERTNQELDPFRHLIRSDPVLRDLHNEWQAWLRTCECAWDVYKDRTHVREYFPTPRIETGISEDCMVHTVITACADYCLLIDDEWDRIADWYRIQERRLPTVKPDDEYRKLRDTYKGESWPLWQD